MKFHQNVFLLIEIRLPKININDYLNQTSNEMKITLIIKQLIKIEPQYSRLQLKICFENVYSTKVFFIILQGSVGSIK